MATAQKRKKLTIREERFCKAFVLTGDGAKAARTAQYSVNSARNIASENLAKPHIIERVGKLLEKRNKKYDLNDDDWNREVSIVAQADLADFMQIDDAGVLKPTAFEDLPPGATKALRKIKQNRVIREFTDGTSVLVSDNIELELKDSNKALDMWGKAKKRYDTQRTGEMPMPILIKAEDGAKIAILAHSMHEKKSQPEETE